MKICENILTASFFLGLIVAMPSEAFANSCVQKVKQCELTCMKKETGFLDILNCKVQECAIAKICSASSRSSSTPAYKKPTYEREERPTVSSRTNTYERSQERSSGYSNQSQTAGRTLTELKRALSQKGGSEAKNCIAQYRARVAGTDNVWHVKNNCSRPIAIGWCYPRLSDSSRLNIHKCDSTGRYKYSGADQIRAGGVKWLQSSQGAQVKIGVCMKDVVLDGKTYGHISTERTGPDEYECSYSSYGR